MKNKTQKVASSFNVSSEDLAEAIRRVGSSAQDAGVSFNSLISLVAAAQERTARGGRVIGNALKTIFTRIQRKEVVKHLNMENLGGIFQYTITKSIVVDMHKKNSIYKKALDFLVENN